MLALPKSNHGRQGHDQSSGSKLKETWSEQLHQEVRSAASGSSGTQLSCTLRSDLEMLEKEEITEVVTIIAKRDGCAPLFNVCRNGNLEIVEYLIETCGADIEQKGTFFGVDGGRTSCGVSPLWCAAVSGHIDIVKYLVKHGANVNSVSDTGSTPVSSACFIAHLEIVQFLVEQAGADIHLPNYKGGTCLINSVLCPVLETSTSLCEFLISHGASVNSQDIHFNTALHYAIENKRFETTKLLLEHGADPFMTNKYGDDALQTAALKGKRATQIFNYLLENFYTDAVLPIERRAEMHELMGSTFVEDNDFPKALSYWKLAMEMRETSNMPKPPQVHTPIYSQITDTERGITMTVVEFQSLCELQSIRNNEELLRINALLIAERILDSSHKEMIARFMNRGAIAVTASSHYSVSLCIRLWRYVLQLRIEKNSILHQDTSSSALALVTFYLDLVDGADGRDYSLQFEDLMGTFSLLVDQLPVAFALVCVRPILKRLQKNYDKYLLCIIHLLYLILRVPNKSPEECGQIEAVTRRLVASRVRVRMFSTGNTLLHMSVCRNNSIVRTSFRVNGRQVSVFPSLEVLKYLLACGDGVDVNALNNSRETPLHLVIGNEPYDSSMADHLLKEGAHVDIFDKNSAISPLQALLAKPHFGLCPMSYLSLKCLAARVIVKNRIPYSAPELPRILVNFTDLHRPQVPSNDASGL